MAEELKPRLQLQEINRCFLSFGRTPSKISEEMADELLAKGALGFIQKPFDLRVLANQLDALGEQEE
jgi:hypothetical protein